MPSHASTDKDLLNENAELRARLDEAEETLHAIRNGKVDALVVQTSDGPQIFTLQGLDAELNRFRGEILEQISEVVVALDDDKRVIYLNAAAEQQYGVSASSVLGCHVSKIYRCQWLQPGDKAEMKAALSERGYWQGEKIHITAAGKAIHVESQLNRINIANGAQTGVLSVIRDITERKCFEKSLRESEEAYRVMFEASSVGKMEADPVTGRFIRVNAAYCRLTGYSEAELLERTFQEFIFSKDQAASYLEPGDRFDGGEVPLFEGEKHYVRPDGGSVWVLATLNEVRDEAGRVLRVTGVIQDITERKHVEEVLRESDQRKDEFLAMLGHELRNPLTPISNVAKILSLPTLDEPKLSWASEVLNRNVSHITQLVDDLLDVSRITRGLVKIQRERVELIHLLQDLVESIQTILQSKQQTLDLDLPDPPVYLEGDPVRLTQVFTNLLNNAAKYTGEGGRINLNVSFQGSSIIVRVRDNGMGIESALLPHIFELFIQGKRGADRSEGGLGLGLTLVKKLVDLHGGRITASSKGVNKGSEFVVQLPGPLEDAMQVETLTSQTLNKASVKDLRILLIDDDEDVADSVSVWFKISGHQVAIARNGAEGVSAARDFNPDVILLDIGLPDMDGYQVARKLREQPAFQRTLIIAQSGYSPSKNGPLSGTADFDHYLIKPANLNQLANLLAEYQQSKQTI
ncbi:MAG: PAS domain S-box protein [Methylococcales bacterium]|nr:PAS domain S-box protein [Methylococcales bacterium]